MIGFRIKPRASIEQAKRIRVKESLTLSLEQRISLREHMLSLRLSLIEALRAEQYKPSAECPQCARKMTPAEIIAGFNQDPCDFTTCCTACGYRFEPRLICFGQGMEIELPFYCSVQILAQLPGKERLSPEEFAQQHPAIYRSAVVHHGTLKAAFAEIGFPYGFEEVSDWKRKIHPFLGRLPDTIIAQCVGVSVFSIRRMRRQLRVPSYSLRKMLVEIECC